MASALFDISDDGEDRGYEGANSEVIRLKLRSIAGVTSVIFQVYSVTVDPSLGIAAQPPRASGSAPLLTLVGSSSGQSVSPSTVGGEVTAALPASGSHSYIIRCVVNRGQRIVGGRVVNDASLIYERGVYIPTEFGTRKIVATEVSQFSSEGWADAVNAMVSGGGGTPLFLQQGIGAESRTITSRLQDDIYVTDFMTEEERAAVFAPSDVSFPVNHQPAIQAAVDYAMYRSAGTGVGAGPRVIVPGGTYRLDDTIHLGYGTEFRGVQFIGAGMREGGNYDVSGTGTVLICMFDDRPAIAIQGARSTVVDGFSIIQERQGAHILGVAQNNPADMSQLDPAVWVDPTFPASANSQHAPLAAIAIDPYAGPQPVVHYPDVDYPDFLGAQPQYGKLHSRNVLIQNVYINGFVVGVALQPCNEDANGDFVKLRRVSFRFCVYGYSWGNTQARVNALYDCIFAYVHTALTTSRHGLTIGNPQIAVYSCSFEIGVQVVEILNINYGGGPTFIGCFAEAMYSIGRLSGGGSFRTGGARFQGCEFGFSLWLRWGVPTAVFTFEGTPMQCIFDSCFFYMAATDGAYMGFKCSGASNEEESAKSLRFTNCQRDGQDMDLGDAYQRSAFNGTLGMIMTRGSTALDRFAVACGHISNIDTGAQEVPRLLSEWVRAPRVNCAHVYATHIKALSAGGDPGVPVRWRAVPLPNASVSSQVGRLLTISMPGITTASLMGTGGDVGDVLVSQDNGVAFLVRSRTGTTLLLEAMNGYDKDDNIRESLPEVCTFFPLHCRRYSIGAVVYADVHYDSPTLTNVVNGTGSYADIAALFTVGDYLVIDPEVDTIIGASLARLASFDNVAKTMTFDGNFNADIARRRITLWARPAMANVAA